MQDTICLNLGVGLAICPSSRVCVVNFLEQRATFIFLLSTFYLARFGPLFNPVKLFWVPTGLPSYPAAESPRDHELFSLRAPWADQMKVKSLKGVLIHLILT